MDNWIFNNFSKLLLIGTIGFFIFLGILFYQDSKRPTFELKKDEWNCTERHYETHTTYIYVNKVMVPQISTYSVCDNYKRVR